MKLIIIEQRIVKFKKGNVVYERYLFFNKFDQGDNEKFEDYHKRVNLFADNCDFNNFNSKVMIRERQTAWKAELMFKFGKNWSYNPCDLDTGANGCLNGFDFLCEMLGDNSPTLGKLDIKLKSFTNTPINVKLLKFHSKGKSGRNKPWTFIISNCM